MQVHEQNPVAADTIPFEGIVTTATYLFGLLGALAGRFLLDFTWVTSIFLFVPFYSLACGIVNNESRRMTGASCALVMFPVMAACGPALVDRLRTVLPPQAAAGATAGIVLEPGVMATLFCILTGVSRLLSICFGAWRLSERIHALAVRALLIFTSAFAFYGGLRILRLLCAELNVGSGLLMIVSMVFAAAFIMLVRAILRFRLAAPEGKAASSAGDSPVPNVRLATKPNVRLKDVAGMEEVKRQIRLRLIDPVRDSVRAKQYGIGIGGGMLLYGPPGTGKTSAARC